MESEARARIEKQSKASETAASTLNPRLDITHKFQDTRTFFHIVLKNVGKSRKKARNEFPKPESESKSSEK